MCGQDMSLSISYSNIREKLKNLHIGEIKRAMKTLENTANVILVLGDGVAKSAVAIDKEIIAAATLIQILNII